MADTGEIIERLRRLQKWPVTDQSDRRTLTAAVTALQELEQARGQQERFKFAANKRADTAERLLGELVEAGQATLDEPRSLYGPKQLRLAHRIDSARAHLHSPGGEE